MSMAPDCWETGDGPPRQAACPVTATLGTRVRLQTVKAMLKDVSLRRLAPTTYYFCAEPTCAVVYFSQQGECYSKDDLRTTVWQKEPAGSRLLCYCFGESEQTIAARLLPPARRRRWIESKSTSTQEGARATFAIHVDLLPR